MTPTERSALGRRYLDIALSLTLASLYLVWLLSTVHDLGYARDEGFYFEAARSYEHWFALLFRDPLQALSPSAIDRYWQINHEHPALIKSLFAASHHFFYDGWRLFAEQGTAYRFPGMLLSSLALAVVYVWGSRTLSRSAGLVACSALAFMPRVFYHAHLACFDMPVAAIWLFVAYAHWRSLERRSWFWPIATGVLYGLLLDTKHNSWLFPFVVGAHWLLLHGRELVRASWRKRWAAIPPAFWAMLSIGPLLFYATWPWLWYDPFVRFGRYAKFHLGHVYYNMEFLGQTYWKPPMPRGYAWVMTLGTVPFVTLLLFAIGLWASFGHRVLHFGRLRKARGALRNEKAPAEAPQFAAPDASTGSPPSPRTASPASSTTGSPPNSLAANQASVMSAKLFWLLSILVSYAPWLMSRTPIFGGTKHWITAYPFLALLAGAGFDYVQRRLLERFPDKTSLRAVLARAALALSVLIGPFVMTAHSHPWGLSAYTPIVGGAAGAASLGLNRTFWGYTTGAVQDFINERARAKARIFIHDTAAQSFDMLQRDGRLRPDLRPRSSVADSDLALYHHEPHMSRVEYMIWTDYGTLRPTTVGTFDGVPVVWVYERPE